MTFEEAKQVAVGRWPSILAALGIDASLLDKRSHPCPICRDGVDRFTFDDRHGNGDYICRKCPRQNGDGFDLLAGVHGWDKAETLREVGRVLGLPEVRTAPVSKPRPKKNPRQVAARLKQIVRESTEPQPGDLLTRYLMGRGLPSRSWKSLLLHPGLKGTDIHEPLPAMVAKVVGADGRIRVLHRTFLDPATAGKASVDQPKQLTPVIATNDSEKWLGAAVRLYLHRAGKPLILSEGIETGLAAAELFKAPAWACISAGGLEAVEVPRDVSSVIIAADNDANGVGQEAAEKLRARLERDGMPATIEVPSAVGTDWLDEYLLVPA